jgi:dephospho-CoA kinase
VINAALLHRSVSFAKLDIIILVTAPFFTRLVRARKRDGLSWKALLTRFLRQRNFNSQYLAAKADIYRVENPGFLSGAGSAGTGRKTRNSREKLEHRLDRILEGINHG